MKPTLHPAVHQAGLRQLAAEIHERSQRQHLTKSQLAMVVADLVASQRGYSNTDLAKASGVPESYIESSRAVLKRATPNIVAMVNDGLVHVRLAADVARHYAPETQASMLPGDIIAEARKINPGHFSRLGAEPRQTREPKAPKPVKRISVQPETPIQWPTREELGIPEDPKERMLHRQKYGMSQVLPKAVVDLREARMATNAVATALRILGRAMDTEKFPTATAFIEHIALMQDHVQDLTKSNGMEQDFAADARTTLATVTERLPRILSFAMELEALLHSRKAARMKQVIEGGGDTINTGIDVIEGTTKDDMMAALVGLPDDATIHVIDPRTGAPRTDFTVSIDNDAIVVTLDGPDEESEIVSG